MGNVLFTKKKHKTRRVEEVRLMRFAVQSRQQLDGGRYRGWKFFIVVDGATVIGSVSKTKTRRNIVFVFFFSNPG